MCLKIYTDKKDIPKDMMFINYNDLFFAGETLLNNDISNEIMKRVDKATYSSPHTFVGRDKQLGNLSKGLLSTGCKTLLNIAKNPDKCFDVTECGPNALSILPLITEGNILWEVPVLHYRGNTSCDITIHDKHFTDFREFLSYIMN